MSNSPFAIGQRWYCDRSSSRNPYDAPPFWFVIVGKGSRPDRKRCRLEVDHPNEQVRKNNGDGLEQDYTHKHLKKYGRLASKWTGRGGREGGGKSNA